MFDNFKDNMIFTDNETGDRVIFHRKTWLYIIFWDTNPLFKIYR